MAEIIHRVGINGSPEKVFRALSATSPKESIIGIELGSDSSMKGNANG